jgi:hypothetical protein
MRQKLVVAVLCAIFGACSCGPSIVRPPMGTVGSPLPMFITYFNPPPDYERWYHLAEQCAGMRGGYEGVMWGVVPHPWSTAAGQTHGQWSVTRDDKGFIKRVEIVLNADEWRDSLLVMHESLHDILFHNGWEGPAPKAGMSRDDSVRTRHPNPPFEKCAPTFFPPIK